MFLFVFTKMRLCSTEMIKLNCINLYLNWFSQETIITAIVPPERTESPRGLSVTMGFSVFS